VKETRIEQYIANPPWSGVILDTKSEVDRIFLIKCCLSLKIIVLK